MPADVLPIRLAPTDPPAHTSAAPSAVAPLCVDAAELAVMLGLGLRTVRTYDRAGKLPAPIRIGGRVLWRVDEIRAWLDAGAPDRQTWAARRAARK
jgi:predicted DNA-binding transcriptional regulator AlpA